MEQDDGGTSSSYIDPVTIRKWYIRRPWIYCTIPLQEKREMREEEKREEKNCGQPLMVKAGSRTL